LGDDKNVFLGEELLHNKRCLSRCVIVKQEPLSLSIVAPLHPNCIAQPLQNVHVEIISNILSGWYELMVHQIVDVKEFWDILTDPRILLILISIFDFCALNMGLVRNERLGFVLSI
jgi:hypothetical protein